MNKNVNNARRHTRIDHPETKPSAQVLEAAKEHKGFFKFAIAQAREHHATLLAEPLDAATLAKFETNAQSSLAEQKRLEAMPQKQFEDYLAGYYA